MLGKITLLMLLSPVVLLSVGCGLTSPIIPHKEFSRPNYETIRIGETKPEVLEMLGKPTTEIDETWIYVNSKPYYKAVIEFEQGTVKHKRFTIDKSESLQATTAPSAVPSTSPSTKPSKHRSPKVF
jgi:outer membrane protein assembly factor BamE (lipoprotein component of BamABCDE complex)